MRPSHIFHFACLLLPLLASIGAVSAQDRNPASAAGGAREDRRIALVIGNGAYRDGPLRNPVNDAQDIADTLRKLGFEVIEKTNSTQKDMNRAIAQFGEKLRADSVALFFFAGHGMQVKGKNYLIPTDAQIESENMVRAEAVDVDTVMDQLSISHINIVILDACRNNPYERRFRSSGGGLAQMDAPKGSLIAYATAPGKTAADGVGRNGLYTQELLRHIQTPGLPIEAVFKQVRNGVMAASGENQTPWESSSLTGDFYFKSAAPKVDAAKLNQESIEKAVFEASRRANEQAAKERAELQQSLKAQQAASDRAVADAIRRSNEQAVRERAELQQSMERMLKEALARQTAALAAERAARPAAEPAGPQIASPRDAPQALAPAAVPAAPPAVAQTPTPIHLAAVAATGADGGSKPTQQTLARLENAPGDEWEYLATDEQFGKRQKLVLRVKAASPQGVLEEILWNGTPVLEWVFDGSAGALGMPNESEFMFAPHWDGGQLADFMVRGGKGLCTGTASCRLSLKVSGTENLSVAAGTFEAIRLDGWIYIDVHGSLFSKRSGSVTIWYSKELRRLLKQSAHQLGSWHSSFNETLELSAIRRAAP